MRSIILIALFLISSTAAIAQPQMQWVRTYDFGRNEIFSDIYSIPDGGFAICGKSSVRQVGNDPGTDFLLARLTAEGEVIWSAIFGEDNNYEILRTVIQTDDGCFLTGGWRDVDDNSFMAYLVSGDGEIIWENCYGSGGCHAVIELKSGFFLLAGSGKAENGDTQGNLICINREGDVIWQHLYGDPNNNSEKLLSMRETEGGVAVQGQMYGGLNNNRREIWLLKVNLHGELLWSRLYDIGSSQLGYSLVSCPEGGFMIGGHLNINSDRYFLLLKVDDEGNRQWFHRYSPVDPDYAPVWAYATNKIGNSGYALAGPTGNNSSIVRVDPAGNEEWSRYYDGNDIPGYHICYAASVTGVDNSTIVAGFTIQNETGWDGLVVKLIPERSAPKIVEHHPSDLEFETLPDSINFWVHAIDLQGETIDYAWTLDGEVVANDSFKTIHFSEFGDYHVKCVVRDTTGADSVQWLVHVVELYIDEFTPDSLEMYVRRGAPVDFSATHRAVEGDPVNYLWTLTDLHTQRDTLLGETDSITALFTKAHDYQVEAIAYRNQVTDAIHWLVHSCSTIWEWWPRELELTLAIEDTTEFSVWPFNPDSDSLLMEWSLDGELFSDEWETEVAFDQAGHHAVTVIVNDGCESDTLTWHIDAYDPDGVVEQTGMLALPEALTLYPVYPNPFNAEAVVSFYLPEAGKLNLQLYDLSGRSVITPVEGIYSAGFQTLHLDGSALPTGIYLILLKAGGERKLQRVVVMK